MGDAKRAFGKVGGMTAITNAVRHSQNNIQLEYAACIAYQQMATKSKFLQILSFKSRF